MDNLGRNACIFIKNLMEKYLVEHDYGTMKSVLHKDISCIGSGVDELWNGFEDACTKLEILSRFDNIDFTIEDNWYEAEELNEHDVIVYGEVQLKKILPNSQTLNSRFRISAVCHYNQDNFIIRHMHFSLPITSSTASNDKKISSIREHRSQLADKVQELLDLTNGIRGGVEVCQVDNGYTIQYLSNGFTDLLNYTEDELKELIGSPHRTLIYETDAEYDNIVQSINNQLLHATTYSVEYRMIQKGGNYIWVLENGRILEENGEKRLQCLIVDIHNQKMLEHELQRSKMRYELAVKATKVQMFEFDIETQDIHMFVGDAQKFGIPKVLKNAGEDIVHQNLLSPACVDAFQETFKKVTNGSDGAECDIAFKTTDDTFINYHLSMTTGFSDSGKPLFAIGVIKDIQEIVDLQLENKLSKTLLENRKLGTFEVNVTQDLVTNNTIYQDKMLAASPTYCYSELLKIFVEKRIYASDREVYIREMCIDTLRAIEDYESTFISLQYRRRESEDTDYRWWSVSGRLYKDSHTGYIKAFFYEEDIHDQKEQEMTLKFDAEHDKMTGYYNKQATEKYIRDFLKNSVNRTAEHALFVIDLDHFKDINDTFGHVYGDSVLIEESQAIQEEIRNSDIIGRIGGDECCILIKNIVDIVEIKQKAQLICNKLKKTYTQNNQSVTVSASIGIALASSCDYDYDKLFAKADAALYKSKDFGRNRYTLL